MNARSLLASTAALTALIAGCADPAPTADPTAPAVTGLEKSSYSVGETMWFYGRNFAVDAEGRTRLHFRGTYTSATGQAPVRLTITPLVEQTEDGRTVARWSRFGPFTNPFDVTGAPGVFEGNIIAETTDGDATRAVDSKPETFRIEVKPSILIETLQPIQASCGTPAVRALAGLAYHIGVRAVGIEPVRWDWSVARVNGQESVVTWSHDADATLDAGRDVLGDGPDEPVIFEPVPDADQFYVTIVRVVGTDAQGNQVETALPLSVHRPFEVAAYGERAVAEVYEPFPASGCIPGSIETRLRYAETRSESRQRSVSVTVSQSFAESTGISRDASWSEGVETGRSESQSIGSALSEAETLSETQGVSYTESSENDVQLSTTNGTSWEANLSQGESNESYQSRTRELYGDASASATVGVEVEGSVPFLASASGSASTTVGVRAGARAGSEAGTRQGVSSQRGFSASGSTSESTSFGSTVAESQSTSVTGSYALTRSRSRDLEDTTSREQSETWTMARGASVDEQVSVGLSMAEQSTWSSTSTESVTLDYSGLIPNGRFGQFFRQTTRWVRRAEVRAFDLCGVAQHMGELQFNEWAWAPDLAIGDDCSTVQHKLPPARCFVEPCDG